MIQKRLVMVGIRRKGSKKFTIRKEGNCLNYLEKNADPNRCACADCQKVLQENDYPHSKSR